MTDAVKNTKSGSSSLGLAITYVTILFFIWALITNLLDPLLKAMKTIFTLNAVEANLTGFAFFIAYGVMSMPAASFLSKNGYVKSVIVGLGGIVLGCLIALGATMVHIYPVFLVALFTMASGITLLQVAANPLIAAMGDPKDSAFRLNLSQAFNSLGAACGVYFGSSFLLKGEAFKPDAVLTDALKAQAFGEVGAVYLKIGIALAIFIGLIFMVRKIIADNAPETTGAVSPLTALQAKWANLGALAIFFYVGAEVAIGANLILFIEQKQILGINAQSAGQLATYYMIFAMIGRFGGSALLKFVKGYTLLTVATVGTVLLCAFIVLNNGVTPSVATSSFVMPIVNVEVPVVNGTKLAMAAIFVGLFNSIMFPTIFTTTLERSSAPASATSGLLCVAIVGGAFIPLLFASVRDMTGSYSLAFIIPMICYLYIMWFSLAARNAPVHKIEEDVAGSH
ncbi:sugar MFS transporter [Pseudaquidulcibacter saccharophilus]|uniref:sugar MFS transporter n=1 Tax=Pseudaquidulcibacter saccharophilus TaxID=2831900 RepID=UPI001EFF41C7|nr:sugar MFS transporter [Pseudaquidulcibacter saccharophilus]